MSSGVSRVGTSTRLLPRFFRTRKVGSLSFTNQAVLFYQVVFVSLFAGVFSFNNTTWHEARLCLVELFWWRFRVRVPHMGVEGTDGVEYD